MQTLQYSRASISPAIGKHPGSCCSSDAHGALVRWPPSYFGRKPSPGGRSIGHREQQNAIVRLVHNNGQISKLVDGHAKLWRARQTQGLARRKWI